MPDLERIEQMDFVIIMILHKHVFPHTALFIRLFHLLIS